MLAEAKFEVERPDTERALAVLARPEPSNELNDEPLTMRLVVLAVAKDEYIVEEEYGAVMRNSEVSEPSRPRVVEAVAPTLR